MRTRLVLAAALASSSAWAQAPADPARVAALAGQVAQVEAVRAVKRLQTSYAQYSEFGLWSEMAALFSRDASIAYGDAKAEGRAAIARWLKTEFGGGREGLPAGGVHTQLTLDPVITLGADGRSAKGRWHEVSLIGRFGGEARWAGGIQENDYVLEDGVWKISRLHHHPLYAGSYADGWRSLGDDIPVVPYHFTGEQAGAPFSAATTAASSRDLARRIGRLRDEDLIRNLQNAYGYYVDQKLWSDVVDLFTADGSVEIAGSGIWKGAAGIRRLLGRDGPTGLRHGEVNEHLQLDITVTVAPGGEEAWARGLDFGMLGRNDIGATWSEAVFENRYVKQGGVWRIAEMRLFPKLRSDYYQGWALSQLPEPVPARGFGPDAPSTLQAIGPKLAAIPAFRAANPATGKRVAYPAGIRVIGEAKALPKSTSGSGEPDLPALERQLAQSRAWDTVENVSSAFGYFLDDFRWDDTGALFARDGRREKYQVGIYAGKDRVRQADARMYGSGRAGPRINVQFHFRTQPVIDVAEDGRSAKLRTRLFSFNAARDKPGEFQSGMYPNDILVEEDGVWKFKHQSINELYMRSAGYKNGWARVPPTDYRQYALDRPPTMMDKLASSYPPDVATADLGVRGQGFAPGPDFIEFPDVKPMWFHYRNPVSGREPPNYCPDVATCLQPRPLFEAKDR